MTLSAWPALVVALSCITASSHALAHREGAHPGAKAPFDASQVEEKAFGHQGDLRRATRVVRLTMSDAMRFTPADIVVKRGETVRFVVRNGGRVLHERVLGTAADPEKHAALMRRSPEMEPVESHMTHVMPGATGEIVGQFTRPGDYRFACLVAGHLEAGMVGRLRAR